MKNTVLSKIIFVFFSALFCLIFITPGTPIYPEVELKYDVSVRALQVPFVAISSRGLPVTDLKKEELELYVDGISMDIGYLFYFEPKQESPDEPQIESQAQKSESQFQQKRFKFILIDSFFSSAQGLKKSKIIAKKLIETGSPNDLFVLLQISFGGLKYVAGPKPGNPEFVKNLEKITKNPQSLNWWEPTYYEEVCADGAALGDPFVYRHGNSNAIDVTTAMYRDSFIQFQNALRTISNPKITYLLSEGSMEADLRKAVDNEKFYVYSSIIKSMNFTAELDKNIHDGGSILKRVYLQGVDERKSEMVASFLTRTTDAYYEIAFTPPNKESKEMKIDIKCTRPGVIIDAVHYKAKEKPYANLNSNLKKVYALSALTGRSSNHYLGRVKRVPFKKLGKTELGDNSIIQIQMPLPIEMQNRLLDVFLIYFGEKETEPYIISESKRFGQIGILDIKPDKEKKKVYFVIIEPSESYCLMNEIK